MTSPIMKTLLISLKGGTTSHILIYLFLLISIWFKIIEVFNEISNLWWLGVFNLNEVSEPFYVNLRFYKVLF